MYDNRYFNFIRSIHNIRQNPPGFTEGLVEPRAYNNLQNNEILTTPRIFVVCLLTNWDINISFVPGETVLL